MKDYYITCSEMTVCVTTELEYSKQLDDEIRIVKKAPLIVKKFEGQSFGRLAKWFESINKEGVVEVKEV